MDYEFDSTTDTVRKGLGQSVFCLGTILLLRGAATCDQTSTDVFFITVFLAPLVALSLVNV